MNSITMAVEAIREIGRNMMENLNAYLETQRELQREREATKNERFRELMEGQKKHYREDAEILATELERMRIEKSTN